jgi:uncharacterized SAM-binding protein YcdF (DUF218 family)
MLLPPASLLFLTGIGVLFARRYRWGIWLAALSVAGLAVLCLPVTGLLLARPFEAAYPPVDMAQLKAAGKNYMVLVLGGGRDLGAIEYPEAERLSNSSLQRIRYGAKLADASGMPLAVAGGAPKGGRFSEAALMRDFVVNELKAQVALVEDGSNTTYENAALAGEKVRQLGIPGVILVTDVTHMPRAAAAFRSTGLQVVPAPMRFQASAPIGPEDFIPSSDGLEKTHRVSREVVGMAWYRLREAVLSR